MTACGAQTDITAEGVQGDTLETQNVQNVETPQGTGAAQTDGEDGTLPVYGEYYYDLDNVVLYLEVYGELPVHPDQSMNLTSPTISLHPQRLEYGILGAAVKNNIEAAYQVGGYAGDVPCRGHG